jgi:DNA-binding MarR family transcriptional regulator
MTAREPVAPSLAAEADEAIVALRHAFSELLGAERRLRARDRNVPVGQPTVAQFRALFWLAEHPGSTAGELAKASDLSPASVTAMLDHLEDEGHVVRQRSKTDRRIVRVACTESGQAFADETSAAWSVLWREKLSGIDDAQIRIATEVMRRVAGLLDGAPTGQAAIE